MLISVADNGPGVPKRERDKIFLPFHSTKGHAGTGLGLAVARKNVNELGGSLELLTPPSGGSEFLITPAHRRCPPRRPGRYPTANPLITAGRVIYERKNQLPSAMTQNMSVSSMAAINHA